MARSRVLVAALGMSMALAACGTTVPVSSVAGASANDGLGSTQQPDSPLAPLVGGGPVAVGGPATAAPAPAGGLAPIGGSGGAAAPEPGSRPTSAVTGGSPTDARRGPGVRGSSVSVGFQYVDVGAGTSGVLGKNVSIGDPPAQARAVAGWINSHGGLGGKTLTLDVYGAPYADYVSNPAAVYTRICTHYTQDAKVLAVAVYVPDRTLLDCLSKHDVISISDGYSLDRQSFSTYDKYYWSPGSMSQDRGAEVGVAGLAGSRFLTPSAKIGILRYDEVTYARAEVSLRRALKARGLDAVTTSTISYTSTSQAESDAAAAVLAFRARGITHVMVLDNSGGITYAFMQSAESQQYRPFYALTTNNSPQALQQLAPAAQLKKAEGISWWHGDVGTRTDQATPPAIPSSKETCLSIMRKAGVDVSGSAAGSSLITCDQLLLLKAVMDRAAAPNSTAMTAALNGLGTSYSSPLSYASRFGAGRHDAAYVTRRIRFDADCSCWLYAGPGPKA